MSRRAPLSHSVQVGLTFGLTSGVITTLGLLVGLSTGTGSRSAALAGIATIAVADSLSDALGVHMSEESEVVHSAGEIWASTVATFAAKLLMALTFMLPVILLPLGAAVVVAVGWGAIALTVLSVYLARAGGRAPVPVVLEHVVNAALVIVAAYFVGLGVAALLR